MRIRVHCLVVSALLAAGIAAADPLIEQAREAAESYAVALPNYTCQQLTTRFVMISSRLTSWRKQDVVSAEVLYVNGRETYRNLAIDGKPVKEDIMQLSGAWSTGEFATQLLDLFSRQTDAQFQFRRNATMAGMPAAVYDFQVSRENSHWGVQTSPPDIIYPAYKGSVWIDRAGGRTLRIERKARDLPAAFPIGTVESSSDYQFIRIGGTGRFLLPARSETLICPRGLNICSRNTIDFRNYRKYSTEASITFDQ